MFPQQNPAYWRLKISYKLKKYPKVRKQTHKTHLMVRILRLSKRCSWDLRHWVFVVKRFDAE